ncbi:hypothetical protein WDW89_22770 [Deltaproteobacteria bacterium TL4]
MEFTTTAEELPQQMQHLHLSPKVVVHIRIEDSELKQPSKQGNDPQDDLLDKRNSTDRVQNNSIKLAKTA